MFYYILKRLAEAVPVLLIIAALTFFMLRMAPGGPFDQEKPLPADVKEALNEYYGLDKPLSDQFFGYLGNLLRGDLGPSFKYPGWTVNEIIRDKLPTSIELGFYALVLALAMGIPAGLIAAFRQNTIKDYVPMSAAMLGICLPSFVIGPLLILFFSIYLGLFNSSGWVSASDKVLPSITMAIFYGAYIARLTRTSMIEVLNQDYIRTAFAKGLPAWRVLLVHGLRNGIAPVVSYLGPAIAGLISGSFVIETVFHIPGLGRFFVMAAFNRDYTLVLGTVLCYATMIIILNLIADIVLVWLNPKAKYE